MSEDFSGKTALVTGASRGIGLGIARELLSRGASVTITGRKADPLAEAAKQLGGRGADGPGQRGRRRVA